MDFREVIEKRHSVRAFKPSAIDEATLLRILHAGRIAPSGCNVQNREFILIRDRETLEKLHEKIQADFKNAAAAIAIVMDTGGTRYGSYWIEDAAAAALSMLLAIVNEGYDSVWVEGTLLQHEAWAKRLLGVPDEKRLYILLPIGKAASKGKQPHKTPLEEMLYYERYS